MPKGKGSIVNYIFRISIKLNFIDYMFRLTYKSAIMKQYDIKGKLHMFHSVYSFCIVCVEISMCISQNM